MTLFRRSGLAVHKICEYIGWRPRSVYQIGIGQNHEETHVMREEWGAFHLIGCEPHPKVIRSIRDRYPGTIVEVAIADYVGETDLYSKSTHKDGSSIYPHADNPNDDTFKVKVTTIDTLWPEGPAELPCLLWVDCEGAELAALRGGEQFVEKVDVINVELTGKRMWCQEPEAVLIHKWIKDHGFRRQWVHTQRAHIGQSDVIYVRPHLFSTKICCCQCELMDEKYL